MFVIYATKVYQQRRKQRTFIVNVEKDLSEHEKIGNVYRTCLVIVYYMYRPVACVTTCIQYNLSEAATRK